MPDALRVDAYLRRRIMKKATLLMSVILAAGSSAALAATPVFQLHGPEVAPHLQAIDTYSPNGGRDGGYKPMQATYAAGSVRPISTAPALFDSAAASLDAWPGANPVAANFQDSAAGDRLAGTAATGASISDESLFYFLKNFKAQPLQKPEHWTMILVGLCFVVYQIRRRPMRTSIGFHSASKLIGAAGA
jgi:hypothetical protein